MKGSGNETRWHWDRLKLFSLIRRAWRKCNQVKKLPHAASYPEAITVFYFCAVEVCGDVGKHLESMKIVITGKDNFAHNGTIVAVELHLFFCTEIIEAICFWLSLIRGERTFGIALNAVVTFPGKIEANIPAGFYAVALICSKQETANIHEAGLTTANWSQEQYAFRKI